MSETIYCQRNRDIILNRGKDYYENNKASEDEKDIKKQYQIARYHNMSDEEKQRLKDIKKVTVKLEN